MSRSYSLFAVKVVPRSLNAESDANSVMDHIMRVRIPGSTCRWHPSTILMSDEKSLIIGALGSIMVSFIKGGHGLDIILVERRLTCTAFATFPWRCRTPPGGRNHHVICVTTMQYQCGETYSSLPIETHMRTDSQTVLRYQTCSL